MDILTSVIGSDAYIRFWLPDFLAEELGSEGACDRYYHDHRLALDISDPRSRVSRRKQQILLELDYLYVAIPPNSTTQQAREIVGRILHGVPPRLPVAA